jgi:hypothetical protein
VTHRIPTKSLVEAVANIVLFITTPVIVLWVQISSAQVIENIGELAIEERQTWAVYRFAGNSEDGLNPKPFLFRSDASRT